MTSPDASAPRTWKVGDLATWRYVPRGGYGYTVPVDVTVVAVTEKRVRVRALLMRGGERVVTVCPDKLRRRERHE